MNLIAKILYRLCKNPLPAHQLSLDWAGRFLISQWNWHNSIGVFQCNIDKHVIGFLHMSRISFPIYLSDKTRTKDYSMCNWQTFYLYGQRLIFLACFNMQKLLPAFGLFPISCHRPCQNFDDKIESGIEVPDLITTRINMENIIFSVMCWDLGTIT